MYKIGEQYEVVKRLRASGSWRVGDVVTITSNHIEGHKRIQVKSEQRMYSSLLLSYYELRKIGGEEMASVTLRQVVSDVFDNTQDALLVEKHLGKAIVDDFTGKLILMNNKELYLAEAKRLEKAEQLAKHKA